jgi:hypothetical protein
MDRRIHRNWLALVAGALFTGLPTLALAQNTLSVPNTTASAGGTNVGIPVDYSGPDLTTLAFNVNFDPSFCARLVDPTAITVVDSTAMACTSDCSNGGTSCTVSATCTACATGGCQPRVRAAHLEQPVDCSSGTARIAFNDAQGGVAIGKGAGAILELNVGARTPNASGVFTFTPASIDAHNGPLTITVLGVPGTLTILGPATSTTTTSTTTSTSSSSSTSTTHSTSSSTSTTTSTTRPTTTSTSSTTSSTTTTVPTTSTTSSTTTTRPTTTTTSPVVANTPPTVSIDDLPDKVKRKDLESGRLLTLHITVSEPATITLEILNGRGTSLRQTTLTRTSAGAFEAQISLRHLRGKLTLRVTATDVEGASSVVEQQFRAQ